MPGLFLGEQYCRPAPPVAISDAAQLWAREKGRRFGRMEWARLLGCYVIRFGRQPHDPLMRAWQAGDLDEEPCEMVLLQEWSEKARKFVPLDLEQLGPSGLREMLDRADIASGRGEFDSIGDAVRAMMLHNAKVRENGRKRAHEVGQEMDWLYGRTLAGTPYHTVGIDLQNKA